MAEILRSDFPQLMVDGLKILWDEVMEDRRQEFEQFFVMDSSDRMFETSMGMVGMGLVPRKPEATRIRFDKPRQGRPVTYIHNTFSLAVGISLEAKEDDRSGRLARELIPELADSMHVTREIDAARIFNNAFTAQGYEPDGVALASTAHPLLRPLTSITTYSNRSGTDAALSIASLQVARATLRRTLTESGRIRPLVAEWLVVPPELESLAEELTMSVQKPGALATSGSPGTPNDINVLKGKLKVVVWNYLTGTTQWFLLAKERKIRWYDRVKPNFDSTADWYADVLMSKVRARWSRGFDDARGFYGSNGA